MERNNHEPFLLQWSQVQLWPDSHSCLQMRY
jgi:hypothetical protein